MGQSGLELKPAPPTKLGGPFGPFNLKIAQKCFIKCKKGLTVRDMATKVRLYSKWYLYNFCPLALN